MTDPVFERYKDALKAGHVAALRGRLEDALAHYTAAAGIADDRALPHASAGDVLLRLGRRDEAVAAYERALERAPRDEAALAGRAEALVALGDRERAAAALDALADALAGAGRRPEALAAIERALDLAPDEQRHEAYQRLAHELGVTPRSERGAIQEAAPDPDAAPETPPIDAAAASLSEPDAAASADAHADDPARHLAAAESLLVGGDRAAAALELIEAAEGYVTRDLLDAALDAAGQALRVAPDLPAVHLALARLYFRRGWRERATDTLLLLDRFLEIEGDAEARAATAALARQHLGADPRLAGLAGDGGRRHG